MNSYAFERDATEATFKIEGVIEPMFVAEVVGKVTLWFEEEIGDTAFARVDRTFKLYFDGDNIPDDYYYVGTVLPYRTPVHVYEVSVPLPPREPWVPPDIDIVQHQTY